MSLDRHTDTIVAPITAVGGAVGVVRLSGSDSWTIASHILDGWSATPEERMAVYGRFSTGDDGLAIAFAEGSSYTGEQSVELSCHGSPASVHGLVDACIESGARVAEPGEFTLRAFLNGRIDLTQAEGVRDTVEAQTSAQLRRANLLREGALRESVWEIRETLLGVIASIEASTDFSEEVGEVDEDSAIEQCRLADSTIEEMLGTATASRIARQGLAIAIVGLPNAGKSSLLNAILNSDRAIVTEVPGTTRDTVEECVSIHGLLCRLIDTAGLRDTDDLVEQVGVERTRDALASADAAWYVYDSSIGWSTGDEEALLATPEETVIVANKCDLGGEAVKGLPVSATEGIGLDRLLETVTATFGRGCEAAIINQRHTPLLTEASLSAHRAIETLKSDAPTDLAIVDLQAAVRTLGEITGESTPPDVIDRIFHDFCIGK